MFAEVQISAFLRYREETDMSDNYKAKVIEKYADGREVGRAERSGAFGMEFLYTKKAIDPYISEDKRVIEIGCGGGYYLMNYAPRCKEYIGVDLSPVNIEITKEQIAGSGYQNADAQVGDATNLTQIPDQSFDVVLCLGPLYHLKREDWAKCIAECKRICKDDGVIIFAFINKAGVIAKFAPFAGWENVLTPHIGECVLEKGTDDVNTDIFFYTTPEEMVEDTAREGLKKIRMRGVDFLILDETLDEFTTEQRKIWFKLADLIFESEYATALTNHALFICEKEN